MNPMKKFPLLCTLFLGTCILLASCKPDDPYSVPDTYTFENVNFSGQTTRLDMLEEMVALMETANVPGTSVDAGKLKDMYSNTNSPFSNPDLNAATTKQLKDKCFSLDAGLFESYMDSLSQASASQVPGSNGVAGVITSTSDPSKSYLFSASGMEYTELIEKGMMGAVFYYQITEVYLGEDKMGPAVDNTTVVAGEGTKMEHHWDEAFGYFGVPADFPANISGIRFIGKYCNARNPILNTSLSIMTAYLTGRAAITNKDMETRDVQIPILRDNLEKVFAGTAIHYLNDAKANFADDALRNHNLSEAIGLIKGLKYNPSRIVSLSQIDSLLAHIGNNLYLVTLAGIDAARDELANIYGMAEIKTQL